MQSVQLMMKYTKREAEKLVGKKLPYLAKEGQGWLDPVLLSNPVHPFKIPIILILTEKSYKSIQSP